MGSLRDPGFSASFTAASHLPAGGPNENSHLRNPSWRFALHELTLDLLDVSNRHRSLVAPQSPRAGSARFHRRRLEERVGQRDHASNRGPARSGSAHGADGTRSDGPAFPE